LRWNTRDDAFVANLNELLMRLCESDIDYVVVGGFAAVLHGSSFITRDLDICAALTPPELSNLRSALRGLQPRYPLTPERLSFLETSNPEPPPDTPLSLETDLGRLDVFPSIAGVGPFERVRAGALEIGLWGRRCKVISLDDLILAKQASGRDKDILAVKELRAIQTKTTQTMTTALPLLERDR
jgi:hypothetical protein